MRVAFFYLFFNKSVDFMLCSWFSLSSNPIRSKVIAGFNVEWLFLTETKMGSSQLWC